MPEHDSEDDEPRSDSERNPWNAVAVVGLRVYAKSAEVAVKVLRPMNWEEGENSLDVDDSAADATRGSISLGAVDFTGQECSGGSVMGFRARLGSVKE